MTPAIKAEALTKSFGSLTAVDRLTLEVPEGELFGLVGPDDVTEAETPKTPAATYLTQNVPNPFNPSTTIQFGLAAQGRMTISIYDVSGRLVRTLVDGPRSAGLYKETWDGRDSNGHAVASGVYFYRLRAGTFSETKKMVLTR